MKILVDDEGRITTEPDYSHLRLHPIIYESARNWLIRHDPDGQPMLDWARRDLRPPATPEDLAGEIIWIILCAGRSAQAARTIERRVWAVIREGRPVVEAFGYRAKAAAMERAWREREQDFRSLAEILRSGNETALVDWCGSIPFVGDDTKYQLAKNMGVAVCKPDIWLCRIAGIADRPRRPLRERFARCMDLCRALSEATGDSIAVIDSMIWLACNKGVLRVSAEAGPIDLVQRPVTARPILAEAVSAA
jgi:hypothetical protein